MEDAGPGDEPWHLACGDGKVLYKASEDGCHGIEGTKLNIAYKKRYKPTFRAIEFGRPYKVLPHGVVREYGCCVLLTPIADADAIPMLNGRDQRSEGRS